MPAGCAAATRARINVFFFFLFGVLFFRGVNLETLNYLIMGDFCFFETRVPVLGGAPSATEIGPSMGRM